MNYRIKAIKNWQGLFVEDDYNDSHTIYDFLVDGKITLVVDDINVAYQGLESLIQTCPKGEYYVAEVKE